MDRLAARIVVGSKRLTDCLYVAAIVGAMGVVTAMVVADGGPPSALIQFFYGPILLAVIRFRVAGGIVVGAISGICAGPLAYALANAFGFHITGFPLHWVVRAAWLAGVGGAIGAAVSRASSVSAALHKHLYSDEATELPNFAAAKLHLDELVTKAGIHAASRHVTVVTLRVTNYQVLTSTFGHDFAQSAVCEVAAELNALCSHDTYLARTDRDTFTAIVIATLEDQTAAWTDILGRLEAKTVLVQAVPVHLSFAVGLTSDDDGTDDADQLFTNAESALSDAIEAGHNLALYSVDSSDQRSARARLLGELRSAIELGQMKLAYQPKLDLHTMRITGVEALARWQHPVNGWVSPGTFIPLVEETRLIGSFTRWVLQEAIAQAAAWHRRGIEMVVAVNVSARNLADRQILGDIDTLLEEFGLAPASLELEITESAFLDITDDSLAILNEMRNRGMRVAIDDFGTGYASLAYLRRLPANILKLDKSFIDGGLHQTLDCLMIKRIIQMARDRDLVVVAEGVETAEVLQMVRDLGCDGIQGFHIARPLAPRDLEEFLMKEKKVDSQPNQGA